MAQAKQLEEKRHSYRNSVSEPYETPRETYVYVYGRIILKDDQKKQYLRAWKNSTVSGYDLLVHSRNQRNDDPLPIKCGDNDRSSGCQHQQKLFCMQSRFAL